LKHKHYKPTLTYKEFVSLALRIGFSGATIPTDYQWVVLRK